MKRLTIASIVAAGLLLTTLPLAAFTGGYSLGINFGADEPNAGNLGGLEPNQAAGIDTALQANWNNASGISGTLENLVADDEGAAIATTATVTWTCPNTWSSTGRGEENNGFPDGPDRTLMLGYLDTGAATTTTVTIEDVPAALVSSGYDVIIYALGGVGGRGGSYRLLSGPDQPLTDYKLVAAPASPTSYVEDTGESHDEVGTYMVFNGLSASTLVVEATTTVEPFGGTPRAPINAVQLVQIGGEVRPIIRQATGTPVGFTVVVDDIGAAVVDPDSITTVLDGVDVTPTVSKAGARTTITYNILDDQDRFFESDSEHSLAVTLSDTQGVETTADQTFAVAPYVTLDPSWMAAPAEYDTASPGHQGFIHQMAVGRTPGDANSVWNAFRHLSGGYLDPATGNPYANLVESAGGFGGVDPDGNFEMPDQIVYFEPWININQDVGTGATTQTGSFQAPDYPDNPVPGIPGIPVPPAAEGSTDNIVMESYTYLNFDQAPKLYRIGVNSDDGFHVSWGPETRSALFEAPAGASVADNAAMYSGGKGVSDIVFDVAVPAGGAGVYRTRLVWWEGTGGAALEFFQVLDDGSKVLIGDTGGGSIAAYKPSGAGQPLRADVMSAAPWPGQAAVNPQDTQVQIIIADGTTETVDVNSITLRVNGSERAVTTTRVGDKVRVAASLEGLLPGGIQVPVELEYTAGGQARTASYTFNTIDYPTLPPALGTAIGSGATRGMRWRTHQLDVARGNTIVLAEEQLAGDLGPSFHNTTGQGADGFFAIDFVNFEQDGVAAGNFSASAAPPQNVPDTLIPGIPGTAAAPTDNIAGEALAYLELQPGFYTMVVNSDDGFQVSMGNADNPTYLVLGLFDGGRGSADTVFNFGVEEAGVYLFRLLWFEGGGGANVEWFTVNPDGSRALVNGAQTGAISAFRTRTVPEPEIPVGGEAIFDPPTISDGQVTLSWEGVGTLQETTDLINWTNSANQANPQTVTPEGTFKAYRIATP